MYSFVITIVTHAPLQRRGMRGISALGAASSCSIPLLTSLSRIAMVLCMSAPDHCRHFKSIHTETALAVLLTIYLFSLHLATRSTTLFFSRSSFLALTLLFHPELMSTPASKLQLSASDGKEMLATRVVLRISIILTSLPQRWHLTCNERWWTLMDSNV